MITIFVKTLLNFVSWFGGFIISDLMIGSNGSGDVVLATSSDVLGGSTEGAGAEDEVGAVGSGDVDEGGVVWFFSSSSIVVSVGAEF